MLRCARKERLAAACCKRSAARGFTLIEMLVVVTIVGVLSVAVALSVAPDSRRAATADAQRLALLLEAAMLEGQAGRRQLAMSTNAEGYSFWVAENTPQRARDWQPLTDDEYFHMRRLSNGFHIVRIDVDGQPLPEGGLLIFRRGDPPLFRIALEGSAAMALDPIELRSLPNGSVEMHVAGKGQ